MNALVCTRMQRSSALWIAALLVLSFTTRASGNESGVHSGDWQTVRHTSLILFIPSGWDIETESIDSDITAISPLSGENDPFREMLLVRILDIQPGETLVQFADRLCQNLADSEVGFEILRRGPVQIGNNSGLQIEASYLSPEGKRHLEIFLIRKEDRVYSLTVRGENQQLGGLEAIFDQILGSLYPFPEVLGNTYFHDFFLIQLPESWSVKEGLPGTHVAGISPKHNPSDPFRERVTVGSQSLKNQSDFSQSVEKTFRNLLTQLPGAKQLGRTEIPILGYSAPTLEVSHTAYGDETILRVSMVPHRDRVFVLICSGREPDYSRMKPIFDKILNSFASVSPPDKDAPNP